MFLTLLKTQKITFFYLLGKKMHTNLHLLFHNFPEIPVPTLNFQTPTLSWRFLGLWEGIFGCFGPLKPRKVANFGLPGSVLVALVSILDCFWSILGHFWRILVVLRVRILLVWPFCHPWNLAPLPTDFYTFCAHCQSPTFWSVLDFLGSNFGKFWSTWDRFLVPALLIWLCSRA